MPDQKRNIRIALPSKGLLADGSKQLLADVGLPVYNPNPRQYIAWIPQFPGVEVIFQRPGDIVISVRDGSVDFGITGRDIYLEKKDSNGKILELHSQLGFGKCTLNVIVPDEWNEVNILADLQGVYLSAGQPLKVATKFPQLTKNFFRTNTETPIQVIQAEGALEIAPTVGYADIMLTGGKLLDAEACLIANKACLQDSPETLAVATQLLEMVGAHLRGKQNLAVFANVRGNSTEEIAEKIFQQEVIAGLQGPTISPILTRGGESFYAIHVVVKKDALHKAVREIREIGGSGVVVSPVNYIFEEEPQELIDMMNALEA